MEEIDSRKNCCDRRSFLLNGLRAGIALSFSQIVGLTSLFAQPATKAKACILLWMAGGPSQLETFDPKPDTSTGGEFRAIQTAVPGIHISEHLPLLAREMKSLSIIRSMTSREGNHDRARYYVHTGYAPAGVTRHPGFGAIVAKELMEKSVKLPAYISINGPGMPAGLLGVDFAPFVVRNAEKKPENLTYYSGVSQARFDNRMKLLNALDASFASNHGHEEFKDKQMIYEKAIDLMNSPALTAFDLEQESQSLRDRYGHTDIGRGCLLARRLVENGVRFVEVEMDGWDTHQDNFKRTKTLLQQLDPAFSSLLRDLRERGLLESTLVVWMGEFGRTPHINANAGRDHWPQAWCAGVAGGGMRGAVCVGETDSKGYEVRNNPVSVPDLYSTVCACLGIDETKYNSSPLGRPIRIVDNGKPISQLISI